MTDKKKQAAAAPEDLPLDERIRELICEQLSVQPNEVTPDASFVNDLGADSLDIVELVMALEEEFDLEISEDEAQRIQTVRDATNFIAAHIED